MFKFLFAKSKRFNKIDESFRDQFTIFSSHKLQTDNCLSRKIENLPKGVLWTIFVIFKARLTRLAAKRVARAGFCCGIRWRQGGLEKR